MLRVIDDALKRHKRIYVQVGGRHAVVWQPALERMLGLPVMAGAGPG